jgi:hypothetical protein
MINGAAKALEAIYPPTIADERARNLASLFVTPIPVAELPSLWQDCLDTVSLRRDLALGHATDACFEKATVRAMRALLCGHYDNMFVWTVLVQMGVPRDLAGFADEVAA